MNYNSELINTQNTEKFSYTPYMIKPSNNNLSGYISYIDLLKFGQVTDFGYLQGYTSFSDWTGFIKSVHEHLQNLNERLGGVNPNPVNISVTGVSVSPTSANINVGGTKTLTAIILPSNATNKNVTWSIIEGSSYISLSGNTVTGLAAGTSKVQVKTQDGNYTATATITVSESQPQSEPTGYYWYIGTENSSSISNIQTDNTIAGWHEIGSSLTGFKLDTTIKANKITVSETDQVLYYVIIPNELNIYDSNEDNGYYMFNEVTCNITGYKAYQYNVGDGVWYVRGIIIK